MKKRCLALALLCLLLPARHAAGEWTADIVDSEWSPTQFVAVDKMAQSFAVLVRQSPLRVAETLPCATGQELGDKSKEGDLKTPEGVYFISRRRNSGLNYDLYGDLAFVLNFPNPMDVLRHKSGHGIWIHGRGHAIVPFETQGCVALNTPDIHRVDHELAEGMPVIIADDVRIGGAGDRKILEEGRAVVEATKAWAKAWQSRSEAFFDFHDPEKFSITEGQPFSAFKSNKERLFKTLPWIQVTLFDVRAVPGPDYWVTYFIQLYRSPTLISQGIKRLYWQRGADGRFRVVGMEYEEMPVTLADKHGVKTATVMAEQEASTPQPEGASEEETQVRQLVDAQQPVVEKMAQKAFHTLHLAGQPTPEDQAILDVAQSAKTRTPPTATDAMRQAPPTAQPPVVAQAPVAQPTTAPAKTDAATKAKAMVEAWRTAWEHGQLDAYAAFYAADASQGTLHGRATIKAQKRRLWADKPPVRVDLSDLTITPRGQGFAVESLQRYQAGDGSKDSGRKTLLLAPTRDGFVITEETWSRIGEKEAARLAVAAPTTPQPAVQQAPATPPAQPAPVPPTPAPEPTPQQPPHPAPASVTAAKTAPATPPAPQPAARPTVTEAQAAATVEAWRKAWEDGHLDAYLAFYAPDVQEGGHRGREVLRAQKSKLWATKPPRRITLTDMVITPSPDGFVARFAQDYESRDGSRHKGRKTLLLTPSEGGLVIAAEKWSRR